jgi:uncharacterized membrane protein
VCKGIAIYLNNQIFFAKYALNDEEKLFCGKIFVKKT